MRGRSAQITLTVVCLIFGALLMIQFRTQGKIAKAQLAESATDQAAIISNLYDANVELRREAAKLAIAQEDYQLSLGHSDLASMAGEVNKLRVFTGQGEVSGPGVELRVGTPLRPEFVQDLVNELRNAGAEAIGINGLRLGVSSAVTTYQGDVVVNGTRLEPPLVFEAIGSPETLDRALGRKGGMLSYLRNAYPEADITMSKQASLTLPASQGGAEIRWAEVVR